MLEGALFSDDTVHMALQYSTQWDSLAHVGALFDRCPSAKDMLEAITSG